MPADWPVQYRLRPSHGTCTEPDPLARSAFCALLGRAILPAVSVLTFTKAIVKQRMPRLTRAYRTLQNANRVIQNRVGSMESVFSEIYRKNIWGNDESISGSGSTLDATELIREQLPSLFKEFGFRSLLDAPCGDFNWMKETNLDLDAYWGMDIVPDIVARNRQRFGNDRVKFLTGNLIKDPLPKVDVVLCRDCFNHLDFASIRSALLNFHRSGAGYVLLTTDISFGDVLEDIVVGRSRTLNLQAAPIALPPPVRLLLDGPRARAAATCGPDAAWGRRLGLWKTSDVVSSARPSG